MHGLGNDFVLIDGTRFKLPNPRKNARFLCDRRLGIGADQLLLLGPSRRADFRMQVFNADGSQAEMCGNGLRCLAKYLRDGRKIRGRELTVETAAGLQKIRTLSSRRYRVDMGIPALKGSEIPVRLSGRVINRPLRVEEKEFRMTCVSMGNPHCVLFVDELRDFPVSKLGRSIEGHPLFPKRTNVEFVKVRSAREIEMRVWERGVGETQACGSGACAAMVASVLNGLSDRKVDVKLLGGTLRVEWDRADGHVYLSGPAETVFQGEIEL